MTTLSSPPPVTSSRPPVTEIGPVAWVRKNFFNGWFNTGLTIVIGLVLVRTIVNFFSWSTTKAKWAVIPNNIQLFAVGRYPTAETWRIWIVVALIAVLSGLSWGILARNAVKLFSRKILIWFGVVAAIAFIIPIPIPLRILLIAILASVLATAWIGRIVGHRFQGLGKLLTIGWFASFPIVLWLIAGGFGLRPVNSNDWGGLLLTIFLSVVSIVLCFPLGILLALGRQSKMPIIRWVCVAFIEVIRGVPLISILFVAAVMLTLFLPSNVRPALVPRAIVGLTIFSAAYLAENVRGGLQSVPRGQGEASSALGLNPALTTLLIVLPQALKVSIPAIVGQFISLVQDTTLVSIIGLFELFGISRAILANPLYVGRYAEVFLFIGLLYWLFCYAMSLGSRRLEEQLNTTR